MFTALKIASRFLKSSKMQTLIIIIGIAIGVSVQVFIGLLSKGLEGTLLNKIAGNAANITVYSHKGGIENWGDKINKIKGTNEITSVFPVVDHQAFVKLNDMTEPALIRGFGLKEGDSFYNIKNRIYDGKMPEGENEAIMGKDLAERLGLKVGDNVSIITISRKQVNFTVVGFYDFETAKINKTWLITNLKTAQNLIGFGDKVTSIEAGVSDPYNADIISKKVETVLGDKNLKVENWKSQNKLLVSGIIGQRICTVIIQFFVLLAAVLSTLSILSISVVQKYKQIGILKAMGINDSTAGMVFLFQALILGVLGTGLGLGLSLAFVKGFNRYIITPQGVPVVSIFVSKRFLIMSALIDITASTFAAFLPALKSFKLSPVEVIKNG